MSQVGAPKVVRVDEFYDAAVRSIRWICVGLIFLTFPVAAKAAPVVITVCSLAAVFSALAYIPALARTAWFNNRIGILVVDHVFVLTVVYVTGGLASPYVPLLFLLIIAAVVAYGLPGFAFSLAAQMIILFGLFTARSPIAPAGSNAQLIVKLLFLVIFSLVAEQSVRRDNGSQLLATPGARKLTSDRQRLTAIINSLPDPVLVLDRRGRITFANTTATSLFSTGTAITGQNLRDTLALTNDDGQSVDLVSLLPADATPVDLRRLAVVTPLGLAIPSDIHMSRLDVGDSSDTYVVQLASLTERSARDHRRHTFTSVLARELRTPLATAEALVSQTLRSPALPKLAKLHTAKAHETIRHTAKVMDALELVSRAEAEPATPPTLVQAGSLLNSLANEYRPRAALNGVTLEIAMPQHLAPVVASRKELVEIVRAFLDNAVAYTTGGSIVLSAKQTKTSLQLAVTDTGFGVDATDKTHVFNKFFRSADPRVRRVSGAGLGLTLAHLQADKCGFALSLKSRLDHGSTFTITIPLVPHAEAAASGAIHRPAASPVM